jgi:1-acyl-sn-glycerol-3-phosphate acyltransferase
MNPTLEPYFLNRDEILNPPKESEGRPLSYRTGQNIPRDIWDRLLPRASFGFWIRYLGVLLRNRRKALDGVYDHKAWIQSSLDFLALIESFGGKIAIDGIEKIRDTKGSIVVAGNHMSVLETFVLPAVVGAFKPVTFVVKQSLVEGKVFGPIMRSRDPITVGRANPREDLVKVMEEGKKRLESGISVIVFPQSTRDPVFDPGSFNSIATKLAGKANVPMVPVALKTDFWLPGGLIKDFGHLHREKSIHFQFRDPLYPETSKQNQDILADFILSQLKAWGVQISEV